MKLLMNASYGRFAMKDVQKTTEAQTFEEASTNDVAHVNAMGDTSVVCFTGVCQQLGNACTAGARALMHLAMGPEVLARAPTASTRMFYQDTDSNYNCIAIVRKWKRRGLYSDALGQFKNDTCKNADGVGMLSYFLERKLKLYFASTMQSVSICCLNTPLLKPLFSK